MPIRARTIRTDRQHARTRLRIALAYLETAKLTLSEQGRDEFLNVCAGLAVLAGIAASDSICSSRLGMVNRGDDHRGAAELLASATPDGRTLASTLNRLLDVKDEAHYGVALVSASKTRSAVRWAERLTERAQEEIDR